MDIAFDGAQRRWEAPPDDDESGECPECGATMDFVPYRRAGWHECPECGWSDEPDWSDYADL